MRPKTSKRTSSRRFQRVHLLMLEKRGGDSSRQNEQNPALIEIVIETFEEAERVRSLSLPEFERRRLLAEELRREDQ